MVKPSTGPIRFFFELVVIVAVAAAATHAVLSFAEPGLTPGQQPFLNVGLLLLLAGPLLYWRSMVIAHNLRRMDLPAGSRMERGGLKFQQAVALTAAVQALGLLATAGVVLYLKGAQEATEKVQFDQQVARIKTEITHRLTQPMYGLAGLRSSYAAKMATPGAGPLTQTEFEAAIGVRDLPHEFPGAVVFSFAERVARADLGMFVQRMRREWGTGFTLRSSSDAADLLVVTRLAPLEGNREALGFDIGQEAQRREAAERAVATGQATISGSIRFLLDKTRSLGFIVFLPVYRKGTAPVQASGLASALVGLAFVPVAANDVFSNSAEAARSNLQFSVYDGNVLTPETLLYASSQPQSGATEPASVGVAAAPRLRVEEVLHIGGRLYTVRLESTPEFDAAQSSSGAVLAALGGAAVSFFMALSAWLLTAGRMRAQNLANRMTVDLDRLARVARHTASVVVLAEADGRISWVNEGFTRLTGRALADVQGTLALSLIHPELTPADTLLSLAEHAQRGETFRCTVVVSGSDGQNHWLDLELQPHHDALGHFAGYMQIGTDITARMTAELALQASESFLDRVGHIAGVGGWRIDLASGKITWSKVTKQIHEVPADFEPILGKAIEFYAPEARPAIEHALEEAMNHGTSWDLELPFITAKGRPIWVRALGEIERVNGVPEALVGAFQDITERRNRDQKLHLLVACVSRINDAILITKANLDDPTGPEIVFANPAFEQLTGFDLADVMGKSPRILQGPDTDRAELRRIKVALERGESYRTELLNYTKAGVAYWIEIDISPVKTADGEITHFVAVERDVTERRAQALALREAVIRAEQATASKGQFLANMSHEIRTPMNAIIGMLALLHRTELSAQQYDYASKSHNAAQSLLGLINDILDFSKVEAGKMTLDPQPFAVSKLMRDLAVILSTNAGSKGIEVLFDIDTALPAVLLGDAMRLQQILINLGGNAVKFTAAGQVVVALRLHDVAQGVVHVHFSVKDSGIGIAPENQHKIFAGFSQAEASTTRKFGGTGLGLAISRHMIEMMGGELVLTSALGEGSVFAFTLALPVVTEVPDELVVAPRPSVAPRRVLVVDDNLVACELTTRMVQSWGWPVTQAHSGEQALALVDAPADGAPMPFEVVYLDWHLPGIDGWEVARQMRARQAAQGGPRITIIMVTASGRESLAQRTEAEQASLDGFLVKPLTASSLLDATLQVGSAQVGVRQGRRPAASQRRLSGMRILVVEDNQINQQVAEELLNAEGAQVSLAANGQLGVDAVRFANPQFDAVLMDLQMPVMDGFAATRSIREQLGLSGLPIIAMTANAMSSDREECLAAGMNEHVGKPFDLTVLVKTLRRVTGFSGQAVDAPAVATPRAPAAASAGGIDLSGALARLSGMQSLYLRAARDFCKVLPTVQDELRRLLKSDRPRAVMHMHTIKGNAALLGATALSELSSQLEKMCKSSVSAGEIAAQLPALERTLHATLLDLQAVIAQLAPETPPPHAVAAGAPAAISDSATHALRTQLEALEALLANGDLAALALFSEVQDDVPLSLQPLVDPLAEALQALELDAAHTHCLALIEALGAPVTGSAA